MKRRPSASTPVRRAAFACDRRSVMVVATIIALAPALAGAESLTLTGASATQQLNINARFNMVVEISKLLFFGIGTGVTTYPTPNSTVDLLDFSPSTTIISAPIGGGSTNAVSGRDIGVPWAPAAPVPVQFSFPTSVLPVRVHSNGGQVRIMASVAVPLTSDTGFTGNFANLTVTSDNVNLLAPMSPSPGTSAGQPGPTLNLGPPSNGVTDYRAGWTFTFNAPPNMFPGVYNGRLRYTATSL